MTRRCLVLVLVLVLGWALPGSSEVRVRQGNAEFSIEPVGSGQPVASFYSYNNPWVASAFTGLETPQTSLLFLHQHSGVLSLVCIHDKYEDGSGGAVDFEVRGLPSGVTYAVRDDPDFAGSPFPDIYDPDPPSGGRTTMQWHWAQCCTDGAVLEGLQGRPFCVSVDPNFIQGINAWELVSDSSPQRQTLPSLQSRVYLCEDCHQLDCPQVVTAECDGAGSANVTVQATGSSRCPGSRITNDRTSGGANASGIYPLGSTSVTFTLDDDAGFSSSCETLVIVEDLSPPLITHCPDPLVLPCQGQPVPRSHPDVQAWIGSFTAYDACATVTLASDVPEEIPPTCDNTPLPVTFEAVDEGGNRAACSSSITLADSEPPTITSCPAPVTLECDGPGGIPAGELGAFFAEFQATDDCGSVTLSNDAPAVFPSGCGAGVITTVVFVATDDCDKSASCTSFVTVRDTTAPGITCPPDTELECTEMGGTPASGPDVSVWRQSVQAADSCGPVTVSDDIPPLVPAACPPGAITPVTFVATDDCGLTASCGADLTVVDTEPPVISACPAPLALECEANGGTPATHTAIQQFLGEFAAEDLCHEAILTNDAPGFFPAGCGQGTTTAVSFEADDGCSNLATCASGVTIEDTTAPAILSTPSPETLECSAPGGVPAGAPEVQAWLARFQAEDACFGPVTATQNAPPLLPSACDPGHPTRIGFRAEDPCGNEVTFEESLTVRDSQPPVLGVPPQLELECDTPGGIPSTDPRIQAWLASASAADVCDGATLDHNAPAFFPSGCAPGQTTSVEFLAEDDCGNVASETSSVMVTDTTPPTLTVPPPITLECNGAGGVLLTDPRIQAWLAAASAEDDCSNPALAHDAPALFPAGCGSGFETQVTFTASDDCGNQTVLASSVTVVDSMPPELTVPAPLTLECNAAGGVPLADPRIQAWLASANAADACGDATVGHDAPALFPSGCGSGFETQVTFTATDDCGNQTVLASSVTVVDTTPPELTVPAPLTLECSTAGGVPQAHPLVQAWLASATATDVCDGATLSWVAPVLFPSGCEPGATTQVVFTATDDCGNAASAASSVTVVDTEPPEVAALLMPAGPLPPASAASPGSVCSPPTSRAFWVECKLEDTCDPRPTLSARLLVTHHEVSPLGECEPVQEPITVACGELVEIRLVAPPCPARPPRQPHSALTVTSAGVKVVTGEVVVLEVEGRDGCGNSVVVNYDPSQEPSPLCGQILPNGTCCPAIAPPPDPPCPVPPCG